MEMLLRFETVYLLLCALIASYTVASNVDIAPFPDKSRKKEANKAEANCLSASCPWGRTNHGVL